MIPTSLPIVCRGPSMGITALQVGTAHTCTLHSAFQGALDTGPCPPLTIYEAGTSSVKRDSVTQVTAKGVECSPQK